MHRLGNAMFGARGEHSVTVGDVGDHQRDAGDRLRVAELQCVEDHDVGAVGLEAANRVRSDVPGATGDKDAHLETRSARSASARRCERPSASEEAASRGLRGRGTQ